MGFEGRDLFHVASSLVPGRMYLRSVFYLMVLHKIVYLSGSTWTIPDVGAYVVPVMTSMTSVMMPGVCPFLSCHPSSSDSQDICLTYKYSQNLRQATKSGHITMKKSKLLLCCLSLKSLL
jgi:hypothetical protein